MEKIPLKIDPKTGVGFVKFGDKSEQVRRHLGRPDEIESLDEAIVFWHYRDLKLDITFRSEDWPFATMEKRVLHFLTRHTSTTIWGRRIIGIPEMKVLDIFRDNGIASPSVSDETQGSFKYRTFRFEKPRIVLEFRNGLLLSILCGDPARV
ncbi:MAG TPA: hypothetical protein VH280_15185 [Verrucomicrobiae bacterium]|jgi:hypothetical protein|nr:hypothetical protein [Verrucomicrobiae bacterium]